MFVTQIFLQIFAAKNLWLLCYEALSTGFLASNYDATCTYNVATTYDIASSYDVACIYDVASS